MKGLSECKASESNIRRIRVKDIIKEVKDYLKTYSSAGMDIAGNSISPKGVTKAGRGAASTCIDKERQALLDFKAHIIQDPRDTLYTWRPEEEDDCCQWDYVTCDTQTGHVTRLYLPFNSFHGNIPESIGNITHLTELRLDSNNFSGVIPISIGSLTKLTWLDLSDNSFYGTIPTEFGNLTNLVDLGLDSLGSCRVENLDWLSSLFYLKYLNLNGISLAKANNWVNVVIGLQNLIVLRLGGCDLSQVMHPYSPSVNSSSSITGLFLNNNNLNSSMFRWLCPLIGKMRIIKMGYTYLNISGNKFDAKLSDFLYNLSGCTSALQDLDASSNQFTGSLSDEIQNFSSLKYLDLSSNKLNGTISDKLWKINSLQIECFPALWDIWVNLKWGNGFYGNIPAWIGENFSKLYVLSLRSNNFFGTIPLQICQLVTLQILDLSINNFHGTIPSCVNNLTTMVKKGFFVKQNIHHYKLEFVAVSGVVNYAEHVDNKYIDNIMIKWQGKVNEFGSILGLVKTIDLSSNNLTGQIPNEVTTLHELLVLDLSNNTLVGEIPRDIGQMTELLTLNLSRNRFSGEIPSTMSKMDRLNNLDVSYNNLSGRVPTSTQLQSFPARSFTGNAGLCGLPTTKNCLEDENLGVPHVGDSKGDAQSTDEFQKWFYIGGATGFATAFWIACSALLVHRRLRHAFFHFHDCLKDWVYVKVVVFIARLQRVARS
ncbi:leucine-rich repeat-containing protein [Tanacetum coccineum]